MSTAGIIFSLAPLSSLVSLALSKWPITERTLDELAAALPNISKLILQFCSLPNSAWARMTSLTSVTDLRICQPAFDGGPTIPLDQVIAFASAISRPMALTLIGDCISSDDPADWVAFEEEQRRNNGVGNLTMHIT